MIIKKKIFDEAINVVSHSLKLYLFFAILLISYAILHFILLEYLNVIIVTLLTGIIDLLVLTYFFAGFYGFLFLKISNNTTNIRIFFSIANDNYKSFFIIRFVQIFITVLVGFLYYPIRNAIFSPAFIMTSGDYFNTVINFSLDALFLFALPIAIIGYFTQNRLKPIRSSFCHVLTNIDKISVILILMVSKIVIGRLGANFFCPEYKLGWIIGSRLLFSTIDFFILVYSFILIKEYFYKKMILNLKNKTLLLYLEREI